MKTIKKHEALVTSRAGKVSGFLFLVVFCLALPGTSLVRAQDADLDVAVTEKAYAEQTLRLGVWLDRDEDEVYRKGDSQSVSFQTNEDAFAVVYRIDTEGLVTILWPRSRFDDGFIFGGHEYMLPVSGAPRLRVSSQSGEGFVEAIVSRYPFDLRDLEVDFHHEDSEYRQDFRVVGDPYLAMNEVNFAITGLEDSAEFVVTNYVSYYVHQKVDHPRYLCGQCHYDDVASYHPYTTHCSLHISYDYGWYNRWYFRFGYYPVYYYPAYTYYDPWCYRPWINYWYDPWYVFPQVNIYTWPTTVYVWQDSPYYVGNSTIRYKEGNRVYRPLNVGARTKPVRSARDYNRSNLMVNRDGPGARDLDAMRGRRQISDRASSLTERGGQILARGNDARLSGEDRQPRSKPDLGSRSQGGGRRGGLQIRDDRNPISASKPGLRHSSAGNGRDSGLKPMETRPRSTEGSSRRSSLRNQEPRSRRDQGTVGDRSDRSNRSNPAEGSRTIKPVEPRKKGTRIWNSNRSSQSQPGRQDRSPQVKPRKGGDGSPQVKPRQGGDRSGSSRSGKQPARSQPSRKPAPSPRKDSGRVKEQPRSGGGSGGGGRVRESKPSQGSSRSNPGVRSHSTQPSRSGSAAKSSRGSSGGNRSKSGSRGSGSRTKDRG